MGKMIESYRCNRCGHIQEFSAQCGMCLWGDLYLVEPDSKKSPKKNCSLKFLLRLLGLILTPPLNI